MLLRNLLAVLVALLSIGLGLFLAERPRAGLEIMPLMVGETPATIMRVPQTVGPVVVLAHGVGMTRQAMQPLQLTLARAGYITVSYDALGHGRNSGVPGLQELRAELAAVSTAALAQPGADGRLALLGYRLGAEVALHQAEVDDRVAAVIALSLPSDVQVPSGVSDNLLLVNGFQGDVWPLLSGWITDETAADDDVISGRVISVPLMAGAGLLYAPVTLRETRDWLNTRFGRPYRNGIASIAAPVLLIVLGIVVLGLPLADLLPAGRVLPEVPSGAFWSLTLAPMILTPLTLFWVETSLLSAVTADYLALHLALFGALVLVGLTVEGDMPQLRGVWPGLAVAGYGLLTIGIVLDRYVTGFLPQGGHWLVMAALLPGAVLTMVADAALSQAGRARAWRRWAVRLAFLASLAIAAILGGDELFFLFALLPVMAFFYLSFGVIGGWVGRRTGSAFAMGLGLGIALAWLLAVRLPLGPILP